MNHAPHERIGYNCVMANFRTHLVVGSSGSVLYAVAAVAFGTPRSWFLLLVVAGAIGAILPDIDLFKPSRVSGVVFSFACALLTVFELSETYSISELWIAWCVVFLVVSWLFSLLPVPHLKHRGILHSHLAGCFFMIVTAVIFHRVFKEDAVLAWSVGLFVYMGFIIHLSLDEVYAIDWEAKRLKRSFGTALKLLDVKSLRASALMAGAVMVVALAAPPTREFVERLKPPVFFALLHEKFLPKGNWFGLKLPAAAMPPDLGRVSDEEKPVAGSPIGSAGTKAERPPGHPAGSVKRQVCDRRSCGYGKQKHRR